MRRATLLVLFALLIGALPAGAARPGADVAAGQMAEAFWVDLKAGTFYFAEGFRVASAGLPESYVAVGKGHCSQHRLGGHGMLVSCMGKGEMKEATVEEFFVDPALRSARIDVNIGKQHHVVDWVAEDPPTAGWSGGIASYGVSADFSLGAFAQAAGTVFGQKVKTTSFDDLAFLVEGGGALVYNFEPHEDGTVRVQISFPVRRP